MGRGALSRFVCKTVFFFGGLVVLCCLKASEDTSNEEFAQTSCDLALIGNSAYRPLVTVQGSAPKNTLSEFLKKTSSTYREMRLRAAEFIHSNRENPGVQRTDLHKRAQVLVETPQWELLNVDSARDAELWSDVFYNLSRLSEVESREHYSVFFQKYNSPQDLKEDLEEVAGTSVRPAPHEISFRHMPQFLRDLPPEEQKALGVVRRLLDEGEDAFPQALSLLEASILLDFFLNSVTRNKLWKVIEPRVFGQLDMFTEKEQESIKLSFQEIETNPLKENNKEKKSEKVKASFIDLGNTEHARKHNAKIKDLEGQLEVAQTELSSISRFLILKKRAALARVNKLKLDIKRAEFIQRLDELADPLQVVFGRAHLGFEKGKVDYDHFKSVSQDAVKHFRKEGLLGEGFTEEDVFLGHFSSSFKLQTDRKKLSEIYIIEGVKGEQLWVSADGRYFGRLSAISRFFLEEFKDFRLFLSENADIIWDLWSDIPFQEKKITLESLFLGLHNSLPVFFPFNELVGKYRFPGLEDISVEEQFRRKSREEGIIDLKEFFLSEDSFLEAIDPSDVDELSGVSNYHFITHRDLAKRLDFSLRISEEASVGEDALRGAPFNKVYLRGKFLDQDYPSLLSSLNAYERNSLIYLLSKLSQLEYERFQKYFDMYNVFQIDGGSTFINLEGISSKYPGFIYLENKIWKDSFSPFASRISSDEMDGISFTNHLARFIADEQGELVVQYTDGTRGISNRKLQESSHLALRHFQRIFHKQIAQLAGDYSFIEEELVYGMAVENETDIPRRLVLARHMKEPNDFVVFDLDRQRHFTGSSQDLSQIYSNQLIVPPTLNNRSGGLLELKEPE